MTLPNRDEVTVSSKLAAESPCSVFLHSGNLDLFSWVGFKHSVACNVKHFYVQPSAKGNGENNPMFRFNESTHDGCFCAVSRP